jgi:hypothetical protein
MTSIMLKRTSVVVPPNTLRLGALCPGCDWGRLTHTLHTAANGLVLTRCDIAPCSYQAYTFRDRAYPPSKGLTSEEEKRWRTTWRKLFAEGKVKF